MVKNLENFQNKLAKIQKALSGIETLVLKLSEVAAKTIQEEHDRVYYSFPDSFKGEGNSPTVVKTTKTTNGYRIEASGGSVLFIEYGTGITFNTPQSPRPSGICNIGEYGKGHGKYRVWGYYLGGIKDKKNLVTTRGNPAAVGISKALIAMREAFPMLIKELQND